MRISRVVIRNFRSFSLLDVPLLENTTCVIGENNTGKSNFLHAIRLCIRPQACHLHTDCSRLMMSTRLWISRSRITF